MIISLMNFFYCFKRNQEEDKMNQLMTHLENEIKLYKQKIIQPEFQNMAKNERLAEKLHFINCLHEKHRIQNSISLY